MMFDPFSRQHRNVYAAETSAVETDDMVRLLGSL